MDMTTVSPVRYSSPQKHVLQQTNNNVPVAEDKKEGQKQMERNIIILRRKRKSSPETENRCESPKALESSDKSELLKLRSVRLVDISSQKFGVIRSVQVAAKSDESSDEDLKKVRKLRPIMPNYVTNADNGPYRKPRQYKREDADLSSQSLRVAKPQSLSIARRNARERNRVKQVNQGFATLRNRIPDYISDGYNEDKGRKNTKKLSKVETLRMAVDYIRHLETLLDFKSEDSAQWLAQVKSENLSWNTSNSSNGYPSPVDTEYQQSCVDSPNAPYDQVYVYPERPFYDYDLELAKEDSKEAEVFLSPSKMTPAAAEMLILNDESVCYDKYELFDKIKKESYGEYVEEPLDESDSEVEMDLSRKTGPGDDRNDENDSPLPSINESFPSRNISAFYDTRHFGT